MLLAIQDLHVKYGNIEVLHGINIEVKEGEIVTILGANGAGKSTTLLTISGLLRPSSGGITFEDQPLHTRKAHDIVKAGIAHIPEGSPNFRHPHCPRKSKTWRLRFRRTGADSKKPSLDLQAFPDFTGT